jgi:UDP-glucose:glycoprotein glucosyltransferase
LVRSEFEALIIEQVPRKADAPPDFDAIVTGALESSISLDKVRTYAERLGATLASAPLGHTFLNGKHFDIDDVSRLT